MVLYMLESMTKKKDIETLHSLFKFIDTSAQRLASPEAVCIPQ